MSTRVKIVSKSLSHRLSKLEDPFREPIKELGKKCIDKFMYEVINNVTIKKIKESFKGIFKTHELLRENNVPSNVSVDYDPQHDIVKIIISYKINNIDNYDNRCVEFIISNY